LTDFNIPSGALTPVQAELTAYETVFTATQNPNRGKVDVLNKNEAQDALKSSIQAFVKAYLAYNPAVTDADKKRRGLPLHDLIRTPAPPANTDSRIGIGQLHNPANHRPFWGRRK
jgi:hypothetical protein